MSARTARPLRAFLTAATDPRALNWRAMLALLGTYLLVDLLTVGLSGPALVATLAAFALQWGLVWGANKAVLARGWPRRHPMLATIITFFLIAIVGAITSSAVAAPHDGSTPLWRFALTLVVSALYVVLSQYRADVARERATQDALREARDEGAAAIAAQREEVIDQLIEALESSVSQEPVTMVDASTRVRELARERIRPLSHELMSSLPPTVTLRSEKTAPATWRQVFDSILSVSLVPPLVTAIVVTIVFISRTINVVTTSPDSADGQAVVVTVDLASVLWSWAGLALVFAVTYFVAWFIRRITSPVLPGLSFGRRVALSVAAPLVIALAIETMVQLAYLTPMVSDDLKVGFFQRIILAVPIVVVALFVVITRAVLALITVSRQQEEALTADARWEVARINDTLRQERRFFAMQAHGPLQSAAAAAAARLESVADEGSLRSAWSQAGDELRRSIDGMSIGPNEERDLPEAVKNLTGAWQGICTITSEMDPDALDALRGDWIASASAVEITIEAIGNATMHGSATSIRIEITMAAADVVSIEVTNNGDPLPDDLAGGLGTSVFEDLCINWDRSNTVDGVRVWALIPVAQGVR